MQQLHKNQLKLFRLGSLLSVVAYIIGIFLFSDVGARFVMTFIIIGTIWIVLSLLLLYNPKEDSGNKGEEIKRDQSLLPQIFGFLVLGLGIVFLVVYSIANKRSDIMATMFIFLFTAIIITLSMYCMSPKLVRNRDIGSIKDYRTKTIIMKISSLSILWAITIIILNW